MGRRHGDGDGGFGHVASWDEGVRVGSFETRALWDGGPRGGWGLESGDRVWGGRVGAWRRGRERRGGMGDGEG